MGLAMLIILISHLVQNKKVSVHYFSGFPKKTNLFYHLLYLPSLPVEMLKNTKDKVAVNS